MQKPIFITVPSLDAVARRVEEQRVPQSYSDLVALLKGGVDAAMFSNSLSEADFTKHRKPDSLLRRSGADDLVRTESGQESCHFRTISEEYEDVGESGQVMLRCSRAR
jgi:hypothetical protein